MMRWDGQGRQVSIARLLVRAKSKREACGVGWGAAFEAVKEDHSQGSGMIGALGRNLNPCHRFREPCLCGPSECLRSTVPSGGFCSLTLKHFFVLSLSPTTATTLAKVSTWQYSLIPFSNRLSDGSARLVSRHRVPDLQGRRAVLQPTTAEALRLTEPLSPTADSRKRVEGR